VLESPLLRTELVDCSPWSPRCVEAGDSLRVRGYLSSDQAAYCYRGALQ